MATVSDKDLIKLGRIHGVHGVRGWVKIFSDTKPRDNIVRYKKLLMKSQGEWIDVVITNGREQSKTVVAKIKGIDFRDQAHALIGNELAMLKTDLPKPSEGEFYWTDLIGLKVLNHDGTDFGKVTQIIETGANDVVVAKAERERLIPFLQDSVIKKIDLEAGIMHVEWDPDF